MTHEAPRALARQLEEIDTVAARVDAEIARRAHADMSDDPPAVDTRPVLNDRALHGLAGEIVRAIEPHTESDPVAILLQMLTAFGALVGVAPHYRVEGDKHTARLFMVLVGETAKGRKGTSWGRVHNIFLRIQQSWPRVVSGLVSGEGFKWCVRDPIIKTERDKDTGTQREVTIDAGIEDKRLVVVEPEFVQILRVIIRQGNTLSADLRSAWDHGNLGSMSKNNPATATGAHVCIIAHVTADELRAELTQNDTANGLANRFLFACVKRSKCLPFGGEELAESVLDGFANRLKRAAIKARTLTRVQFTERARPIWAKVYPDLSDGHPGLFGAVTGRAEAQTVRLALIYALLDESDAIDAMHLLAALAVWQYCADSARVIFGDALGDPVADEILRALRQRGPKGMTRTEIRDLFKRHQSAGRIGAGLELLARHKLAASEVVDTAGRPVEVWRIATATKATEATKGG